MFFLKRLVRIGYYWVVVTLGKMGLILAIGGVAEDFAITSTGSGSFSYRQGQL